MVAFKRAPGSCAGGDCCDPCPANTCLDENGDPIENDFTQITVTVTAGSNPAPRYTGYIDDTAFSGFFYFFSIDFAELEGDYVINYNAETCEWEILSGTINLGSLAFTMYRYATNCGTTMTVNPNLEHSIEYQLSFNPTNRRIYLEFVIRARSSTSFFPLTLQGNLYFEIFDAECAGGELTFSQGGGHPNNEPGQCTTYPAPDDMTADYVLS